jgi:ATP-dependent DNA helicase PIF1
LNIFLVFIKKKMANVFIPNLKQFAALNLMIDGKNVFLTGSAGVGKTALIKHFQSLFDKSRNIAVTSTTGTSALLIGGSTLHSYLGIGLGQASVETLIAEIRGNSFKANRWLKLQTLIIDEVSMLSPELFDKLEEIAREVRFNPNPFGGIQLILSGDFLQLPVVSRENDGDFCFEAKSWSKCVDNIVYLTEIVRQKDKKFQTCLNYLRMGNVNEKVLKVLTPRIDAVLENEFGILPTKIFSTNDKVDAVNKKHLSKLVGEFCEYEMQFNFPSRTNNRPALIEKYKKNCNAPSVLQLGVGAQVMLLVNLDMDAGLANGSRGVVISISQDRPLVKFLNGEERLIDFHTWDIKESNVQIMKATQIPLRLAWAITIHKIQGGTLDYVEIDLSNIFTYGQAYVGLSRVKTLEGLCITGFDPLTIQAHPLALAFYEGLN